jgi:hypothetical protein
MPRRARRWILGALALLVALGTLSYTPGVTLQFADERGAPAADAYVRYHYHGSLLNPVHPVTYVARGSVIARADGSGRVVIPARVHVRRPIPVSLPPTLFIDHAYVPRLHNAFGPLTRMTVDRPSVFVADENREHVTVFDVSGDPGLWERSLRDLFDLIRGTFSESGSTAPAVAGDAETHSYARPLIAHLRQEYADFLERHGHTARQRPADPPPYATSEEDRRLWKERMDADFARDPLWGSFVQRTWRFTLAELDSLEANLR